MNPDLSEIFEREKEKEQERAGILGDIPIKAPKPIVKKDQIFWDRPNSNPEESPY